MRSRSGKGAWSAVRATWFLSLSAAVACSGSNKAFFDAPPIEHASAGQGGAAGAHSAAGGSGKASQPGAGGSAGTAADGSGATSGDGAASGGSPGDTGGAGDVTGTAGDENAGGRGGAGGSTHAGGRGGTAAGGVTSTGGSSGLNAAGGDVTGGGGLAGGAGTVATGGLGGASGLGGMGGSATCVPTTRRQEICDGLDNDCDGEIDGPDVCPDGCHGAIDSDHRYLLCTGPGNTTYTRTDAHDACGNYGDDLGITLDLVRVNSADEDAFVVGLLDKYGVTGDVWNGASDSNSNMVGSTEGTWVWGTANNGVTFYKDGAPVMMRYNHWAAGQPDDNASAPGEDCAVFDPALDWEWNDVSCSRDFASFVCEEPTN